MSIKQPELYPCPCYPLNVKCYMSLPCVGCEDYAQWLSEYFDGEPQETKYIEGDGEG